MANSAFDPLRLDPFAAPSNNEIVPIQTTQQQELISPSQQTGGSKQPPLEEDVLLQFTNSSSPASPTSIIDADDVRKSRKQWSSSRSISSAASSRKSSKTNASSFAPPPEMPITRDYSSSLFHLDGEVDPRSQPVYEKITHSGTCLARISNRTKLLKLWKQVFWIIYEDKELLVFKDKEVFDQWLMNPHLSRIQRDSLVKLHVDFQRTAGDFAYQVSMMKMKQYRSSGFIHQFKLDKYNFKDGPSIMAAFGSIILEDTKDLHVLLRQMLKVSPANLSSMQDARGVMRDEYSDYGSSIGSVYSAPSTFTFAQPPQHRNGSAPSNSVRSFPGGYY